MYNPSRNKKIKSKSRQFNENGIINIVYAGNLGLAQNLDIILDCFSNLKFQNFNLKICGDGSNKNISVKNMNQIR